VIHVECVKKCPLENVSIKNLQTDGDDAFEEDEIRA